MSAGRRVRAQTAMELRLLLRNGENLLVTLLIPAGLLLFFATVDVLPIEGDPVRFLVPGVLALAVMSVAMVSLGIATGFERSYLVLKRLGATPLRRGELVAAKALAVVGVEVVQAAVLLALALGVLGWRPGAGAGGLALGLLAVVLGTAAFAGLGLAMAGRLRAVGTLALANGLYLAMLLLGGLVVPLERLPGGLATLGRLLPVAPLATVLRAAADGAGVPWDAVALLAAWAVGAVVLAATTFRWD